MPISKKPITKYSWQKDMADKLKGNGKIFPPKVNKEKLYTHFAKDAESTSKREKRYAEMARYERKFADKDDLVAMHKKQIARDDDDRLEYSICMDFYTYRMKISDYYAKVAKYYYDLAAKEAKKK